MRVRNENSRRQGTVLVYFALIVFVFLAMAALVIDLGLAMVTRRQMQAAADTAALEGLRARDDDQIPADQRDHQRRLLASNLVSYCFDDNLNPGDGDPWPFGAGPVVQFSGGLQFGAGQTLKVTSPYKPLLQLNEGNEIDGDMVAGTFNPSGSPVENSDYTRGDFTPDPQGSTTVGNAFLVRLRRTGEAANQGVSLPGPPLPYLFGRGTLLNPTVKQRGVLVRATAIADARPVMSVGFPSPNIRPPLPGITPFALLRASWENEGVLPTDSAVSISSDAGGNITINSIPNVGYTFTPQMLKTVGQPPMTPPAVLVSQVAVANGTALDLTNAPLFQYVPVVDKFTGNSGTKQRIIGFGRVEITDPNNNQQFMITKRQNKIAPQNASAALVADLDADLQNDPTQLKAVLTANAGFLNPLLAPALVR